MLRNPSQLLSRVEQIWLENHQAINELYSRLYRQENDQAQRLLTLPEFEALKETDKAKIYDFINGHHGCPACREGLTVLLQRIDPKGEFIAKKIKNAVTWEVSIKNSQVLLTQHMKEYAEKTSALFTGLTNSPLPVINNTVGILSQLVNKLGVGLGKENLEVDLKTSLSVQPLVQPLHEKRQCPNNKENAPSYSMPQNR